jgi:hypothetical protein
VVPGPVAAWRVVRGRVVARPVVCGPLAAHRVVRGQAWEHQALVCGQVVVLQGRVDFRGAVPARVVGLDRRPAICRVF